MDTSTNDMFNVAFRLSFDIPEELSEEELAETLQLLKDVLEARMGVSMGHCGFWQTYLR